MEQYVAYLRKSRADAEAEQRGEGETLARHQRMLQALADSLHLTISAWRRELVSGETIAARPVMQTLLAEVEQGLWAGVLVMEVERLARGDTIDQGLVAQAFRYSGAKIITPHKIYNPTDEFDEEYFEFGLFMSRREYKAINRRLQAGRQQAAREGRYMGQKAPFGYRKIKIQGDKGYTLIPDAYQAPIVELIFRSYTQGIGGRPAGTTSVANYLNTLGIPPVQAARWTAGTIRDILTNPAYIGKVRWKWRPAVKQVKNGAAIVTRPRHKEYPLYDGLHPAIVSESLWQAAQAKVKAGAAPRHRAGSSIQNPLAGLVICGACGRRMVRGGSAAGELLQCVTPGCVTVSAYLQVVEELLLDTLQKWLGGLSVPAGAVPELEPEHAALACLHAEMARVRTQRARLYDLLEQGVYDQQTFQARQVQLGGRLEELERTARSVQAHATVSCTQSHAGRVQVLEAYTAADAAQKNALLRELVERVVYSKTKGGRWQASDLTLQVYPKLPGEAAKSQPGSVEATGYKTG